MRRMTAVWVGAIVFAAALPLHAARLVALEDLATGADPAALPGSHQETPVVGLRPDGAVLVWNEPKKGLIAHFFDTTGAAKGAEVVLAANDALQGKVFVADLHEQHEPQVVVRPDGTFLMAWTERLVHRTAEVYHDVRKPISNRVLLGHFGADGKAVAPPLEIAAGTDLPSQPALAVSGETTWIAWQAGWTVRARAVDDKGRLGDILEAGTAGRHPALAVAGERLVVAWETAYGRDDKQVSARAFAHGRPSGAAFALGAVTGSDCTHATAAPAADGSFLVAWECKPKQPGGAARVYGQRIDGAGKPLAQRLALSAGDGDANFSPVLAALPGGGFAAVWMSKLRGAHSPTLVNLDGQGAVVGSPLALHNYPGRAGGLDMALAVAPDGRLAGAWLGFDQKGLIVTYARAARLEP